MARLGDLGKIITGNTPPKSDSANYISDDIYFVKPSDIQDDFIQKVSETEFCISEAAREKARIIPPRSVLVTCIGIIGKVGINTVECAFNQQINAIIPDKSKCISDYLAYAIKFNQPQIQKIANAAVVPIINKTQFSEINIPLHEIEKQTEIVEVLNKFNLLIMARKQQINDLDQLVKSQFIEIFGDMYLNSAQWPQDTLSALADVVSGITKGRKTKVEELYEVPYMAVSNVKDGYIDWSTIKTIMATQQEIEQYRLQPNDVLMTEGGDPDKLGRGAIIRVPLENCIHQNHIFRVRLNTERLHPVFFEEYLKHQRAKRYFLRCAKQTTGIASINMKQLRALPVLVPPMDVQKRFVSVMQQADKSKFVIRQSLEQLETLKKSLMQEYFG